MSTHENTQTIQVALASEAYAEAEAAYTAQVPSRRNQTYLNVLAVHAVKQYLQWLAIPIDWSECDSHDPIMRRFLEVADLHIPGYGRLECRPVLPGADALEIPGEVQGDRIGYIAVTFDDDLTTATLLGFTETVDSRLPLDALAPVETLLDIVGTAPAALSPVADIPEALWHWQEPIDLGNWLSHQVENLVEKGWQTLEALASLIAPDAGMDLAFNARGVAAAAPVKWGKVVGFDAEQVALVIGLLPSETPESDILVEVYPVGESPYLPHDLELVVLDEVGVTVMQAQARSNKKIQMEFSGESGEGFSIKLVMGDVSVTEAFQL